MYLSIGASFQQYILRFEISVDYVITMKEYKSRIC